MAEVYGNLVIVVILVMEGVGRTVICLPTMHHKHAIHDFSRNKDRRWQCTASMATAAVLGSLYESYRGLVSYRF